MTANELDNHAEISALHGKLQGNKTDHLQRLGLSNPFPRGCVSNMHTVSMGEARLVWAKMSDAQRATLRDIMLEDRLETSIRLQGEYILALIGAELHSRRSSKRRLEKIAKRLATPALREYVARRLSGAQITSWDAFGISFCDA